MIAHLWTPLVVATTVALFLPVDHAQPARPGRAELDLAYVPGGQHKQQLDLYTPTAEGFPTLLFVHGGSLTSGDRKEEPYPRMCRTFQQLGIGCAAMSYRLAPDHAWPAQPNDVASAFSWLKRHVAARGGDADRIFLFGHSSGCLLVATVAADRRYLAERGLSQRDVAGVIPMGCRLNDEVEVTATPPRRYEASWVPPDRVDAYVRREPAYTSIEQRQDAVPARHVDVELPPTLVLIADGERFFPPILRDAAEFVGRARAVKAEADLFILPNRRHMSALERMVTPDDEAVVKIVNFVRAH